jgi:hypothetical protein
LLGYRCRFWRLVTNKWGFGIDLCGIKIAAQMLQFSMFLFFLSSSLWFLC